MVATPALNLYQTIVSSTAAATAPHQSASWTSNASFSASATSSHSNAPSFSKLLDASTADRQSAREANDRSNDRTPVRDRSTEATRSTDSSRDTSSTDQTDKVADTRNDDSDTDTDSDDVLADLNHPITPQEAKNLLQKLDSDSGKLANAGVTADTLAQLKGRLQNIVDSGTPQSVSDILAEVVPAKTSLTFSQGTLPVTTQLFSFLRKASGKTTDDDTDQTADASATDKTLTTITPLAATLTVVAANAPTTAVSAPMDDVTVTPQAPNLDTLVPALTAPAKKNDLPSVNLPSTAASAPVDAAAQTPAVQAPNFGTILQGEVGAAKSFKDSDVTAINTDNSSVVNSVNGTPGLSGTITTNAVAPTVGVLPKDVINQAPVTEQVSVAITQASHNGIDHITIQLSPGDMGRVEVKMHIASDGHTHLLFTVDKPETFDTLSRDARSLERSLQDSGIKADTSSMQFNLRQQSQPHADSGNGQSNSDSADNSSVTTPVAVAAVTKNYTVTIRDGIDIQA